MLSFASCIARSAAVLPFVPTAYFHEKKNPPVGKPPTNDDDGDDVPFIAVLSAAAICGRQRDDRESINQSINTSNKFLAVPFMHESLFRYTETNFIKQHYNTSRYIGETKSVLIMFKNGREQWSVS